MFAPSTANPTNSEVEAPPVGAVRAALASDAEELIAFLLARPADNAYLLGHLARGALVDHTLGGTLVGWWQRGRLGGVALLGSNLVLSHGLSKEALAALAEATVASDWVVRVIVGPDPVVRDFLAAGAVSPSRIELERGDQILLQVDKSTLKGDARSVELRPAQPIECDAMMALDLAMVREELGIDPFSSDLVGFERGWRRRIAEWRAWVAGPLGGPIGCKVDQAAVSPHVVQLAGVYTAPERRRTGLARRAVGEMCHLLLRQVPRVVLYVHRGNVAALRLYHRLGFYEVGRVRSVWLSGGAQ